MINRNLLDLKMGDYLIFSIKDTDNATYELEYEIEVDDDFINLANWRHVIAIVDDQTPNYSCDLRIHPGLDSNWIGQSSVSILAGPKYIPFRATLHESVFTPPKKAKVLKIVVVAGGSDPHNLVLEISKVLATFPESFKAYLFTNAPSTFVSDSRFHFVKIGSSLDGVSKDANLVLTTSSTSSLEFLARGLCVGIACAVDNQKQYYRTLSQLGVAAPIGLHSATSGWKLELDMIHKLVTFCNRLKY
jgi:spore coat polysaccharide biosynthesis predicted glycosyltransferase SpsG